MPSCCRKLLATVFFFILLLAGSNAQNSLKPVAAKIADHQAELQILPTSILLSPLPYQDGRNAEMASVVRKATFFAPEPAEIALLLDQSPEFLRVELPVNNAKPLALDLYRADVFSAGFQVFTSSSPDEPYPYQPGLHYWGIVRNDMNSLAAISITADEISGFVSVDGTTYTLGKLAETAINEHILYNKEDLLATSPLGCDTDTELLYKGKEAALDGTEDENNCVKMYVEVDYDIFVGKGGVTQATNYVAGVFGQVGILYANESINFTVNEIKVWDTVDPYTGPSTSNYLYQFRDHLNGVYNGNLAHLVGYNGSGGIAYVDVLCNSFYGVGYSDINSTYANVPTYSWTIEVVTHEIGHNLGSRHTHDCVWNGNNTRIDGCGPAAGYPTGTCAAGPIPESGTIMSYCHLLGGVGINFNNGFGPQPGDLIRSRVYTRTCLTSCTQQTQNDAGISAIIQPSGSICGATANPVVTLKNFGTNNLTSVTIQYRVDGGAVSNYAWTGNLASNATTNVTLPSITFGFGPHTFASNTINPNGVSDTNPANDGSNGSFIRPLESTYYRDADGDGYGNPAVSQVACSQPVGYVLNNTDCDDTSATRYPGATCDDGDVCTVNEVLDANCNCAGTVEDSDGDGVCDGLDICPGGDDNIDTDGDGIPDFCDCSAATGSFPVNPLTHTGTGSSTTTVNFGNAEDKDPSFTISGLDARLNGKTSGRYIERVTVTWVDGNGANQTYGTFDGDQVSSVAVSISGFVQSVTVALTDGFDGDYNGNLSVDLSIVDYCGCVDSDGDGVCDTEDACPGFDDNLLGAACDDGNGCTIDDIWTGCNTCAGESTSDSDGDGICDGEDICPGSDDTVDSDGDGIPDGCDTYNCANEFESNFSPNPLTHSGSGSSNATVNLGAGHTMVNFTISGLDARLNGSPNQRYIDKVTVLYNTNQVYGVFTGDVQSSVNVALPGTVSDVTVILEDGYDGNSNTTLSVSMSPVQSCAGGAQPEGLAGTAASVKDFLLFPNPTSGNTMLRLDHTPAKAQVIVSNMLGVQLATYALEQQNTLLLPLGELQVNGQIILVTVKVEGQHPQTKRLMVTN